ncbi:MAG: magnesium transporter [Proteobacteria bacterium]|nr:MAG: magnesium transporter [Pseudomonadota bacterium]TDJ68147.1 MAG: magnesium transporter [Pseudomonadota bacterium]
MTTSKPQEQTDYLAEILAALESEDSLKVQDILADLHPADIAGVLEGIPPEQRHSVWRQVDPETMGEVLVEVPEAVRSDLLEDMDHSALVTAVQGLETDDIADLLPELSAEVTAEILFFMDKQGRQRLDAVLSFPEDTAGGLMNVDAVTVRENITLQVVLRYLRLRSELPEYMNELYVVDRTHRLTGTLQLAKILTSDPKLLVRDVMDENTNKLTALMPDREVAAAFERYNLINAPVVDEDERLLGRITVDDVVDVIREEADHSVMAPAGLSEEVDIFAPVIRSARDRAVWLGVNLITAVMASWVIGLFEDTIKKVIALAVLMPIVASMGGNAGTQTVTLVVRGLAVGTITDANARGLLVRELMVGVLNSMLWALVVALVAVAWFHNLALGLIIAVAMIINLVFAALAGVVIPVAVRRLGIDPALASGVALTTVTDVVGFLAFLGLATLFLI